MSERFGPAYLPTNFREFLTVLEGLRVSSRPGRGMQHIEIRPVLRGPLRKSEEAILCAGKVGEFSILLQIYEPKLDGECASQQQAIPITSIQRAVVESDEQRSILLNRRLDNVPSDILNIEVDPSLFGGRDDARFSAADVSTVETAEWRSADQICGALAAALAAAEDHPEGAYPLRQFLHEDSGAITLADLLSSANDPSPATIAAQVLRQQHGDSSCDGELLLSELTEALRGSSAAGPDLEKFHKHTSAVLSSDAVRVKGSLSDEKNILLRALALVVQRSSVLEILCDRIGGERPGPQVQLTAAVLGGLREGFAHLPSTLKAECSAFLGEVAASVENGCADLSWVRQLAVDAGFGPVSQSSTPTPTAGKEITAGVATFEVCKPGQEAVLHKALRDLARRPLTWRLVIEDDLVFFQAPEAELESAEAELLIAGWKKRGRSRATADTTAADPELKTSRPRKRKSKTEGGTPDTLLPGIVEDTSDTDEK